MVTMHKRHQEDRHGCNQMLTRLRGPQQCQHEAQLEDHHGTRRTTMYLKRSSMCTDEATTAEERKGAHDVLTNCQRAPNREQWSQAVGNEDLHLQERVRHQHEALDQGSASSVTGIGMKTATTHQPSRQATTEMRLRRREERQGYTSIYTEMRGTLYTDMYRNI